MTSPLHGEDPGFKSGFFRNGGKRCYIGRIVSKSNSAKEAFVDISDVNGINTIVARAIGPGSWGNRIFIKFDPDDLTIQHKELFKITVMYFEKHTSFLKFQSWIKKQSADKDISKTTSKDKPPINPDIMEVYDNLSTDPNSPNYFKMAINGISNLVTLWNHKTIKSEDTLVKYHEKIPQTEYAKLDSNIETAPLTSEDFDGERLDTIDPFDNSVVETIHTGLRGFEKLVEISIVCAPDQANITDLQGKIITHCENLKDRFAILETKREDCNSSVFGTLRPERESKYAAIYFPWINIIDPVTYLPKLVPPSGHIAGIYARTDTERGVHKAPANEVVRGADSLQVTIDRDLYEVLNPKGLNVIRAFPGRGIVVWGARTMSTDPSWKYINIRRLFIFIEKSIERATQWIVFEPNNEKLWSRVTVTITQFLTGVWRTGALMGTKTDDAFFVKCDRSTMTQDDIDNGRLVCLIGIAPTKPAEFVIFRIAQTKSGVNVEEF